MLIVKVNCLNTISGHFDYGSSPTAQRPSDNPHQHHQNSREEITIPTCAVIIPDCTVEIPRKL